MEAIGENKPLIFCGSQAGFELLVPSCPNEFIPTPHTDPSSSRNRLCPAPEAILVIFGRMVNLVGLSIVNSDFVLYWTDPHIHTHPELSKKVECLSPQETRIIGGSLSNCSAAHIGSSSCGGPSLDEEIIPFPPTEPSAAWKREGPSPQAL